MIAFQSLVPALSLGAIDTASAAVVILAVAGVALVVWGSRPSVIARYSAQSQRPADAEAPAPAASASPESKRPA
ncbi:MAG TPA: hypothetical protein VEQ60_16330 [Longimicrobium sp.]|nr:hypothetical protein [Longimicrobium sp.]